MIYFLLSLVLVAGIVIYVFIDRDKKQKAAIQNYEHEIDELIQRHQKAEKALDNKYALQLSEQESEYKIKLQEVQERHYEELLAKESDFNSKIYELQCSMETRKEDLSHKNEKELLVDILVDLDTYSHRFEKLEEAIVNTDKIDQMNSHMEALLNQQETAINNLSNDMDEVISMKAAIFNVADSIMAESNKNHNDILNKLGVGGNMTVASILADIIEMQGKS